LKVFVLGLDGASYQIMNHMIHENKLPTFGKLVKHGGMRLLNSTIPPHTAPGWVTAFTGVNPGKHGIYQFYDTQAENYAGKFMGSGDTKCPFLWSILNSYGKTAGIVNVPMTHPPQKIDGFMVTWPLSNTLRYCYPDDLVFRIAKEGGHYANDLACMNSGENDAGYISEAIKITHKRVKTIEYLTQNYNWDLFTAVFTEIDRVSHYYWHYMDSTSPYYISSGQEELKNAVETIYRETDSALEQLLAFLPEDTVFVVLSDHGFGMGAIDFYVQAYLYKKGYLGIEPDQSSSPYADSWFSCEMDGKTHIVDWSKTSAYMAAPGSYGININLTGRQQHGIVAPEEYEALRGRLIHQLSCIVSPASGRKLFRHVARREEVYFGGAVSGAPDILLLPYDYGTMVHHSLEPGKLFGIPEHKGMHRNDGVLILYQKDTGAAFADGAIHMEDITPSILNCFGIPVPAYMDGRIAFHTGQAQTLPEASPGMYIKPNGDENKETYGSDEMDTVRERLKSLGYI